MTIEQFAKDFPVVSRFCYLNTAASGLISEGIMEWRQNHDIDFLIGGSKFRLTADQTLNSVRTDIATYFNSSSKEVFLTPNFTFALKTLVSGMDKSNSVLLLQDDYPSLSFPFYSSGLKVHNLEITADLEDRILQEFKDNTPDVFAFSLVQYISGIKLDINFINSLKKQYPQVLFIADATQYSGTEMFSFKDSGIDIFGGSGYKWLLSGYGNAYLLVKEEFQEKFYSNTLDLEPLEQPFLQSKSHLQLHLEAGHLDTLNFGSLGFSLRQFTAIGQEVIQNHIAQVSAYAKEQFLSLGLLDGTIVKRTAKHSNIFNLQISDKQAQLLSERNIVFSKRGTGVRLSFHLYNTKKDVDKVVKVLRSSQK
ncbi:class V aminotransferase [Galbibacter marinus]|uniref:Class V aminotransferase n=1 Tax=Galbibacter marinus TaxID=555500 RepID=K2PTM2_9FLAO|nr:aminotransferase class V-fold PLP-dependent enzyme [Galbibacter marinus]EKF55915.1 class V aminotransferase [Galbibacter marinus]